MLSNIIVGIITGLISSFIVSVIFDYKSKKSEFEKQKYELSIFLNHIFDELTLAEDSLDLSKTIWLLACRVYDSELQKSKNQELLKEIDMFIEEVYEFCFGYHGISFNTEEKNMLISFEKRAIKYSEDVLKMKFLSKRSK